MQSRLCQLLRNRPPINGMFNLLRAFASLQIKDWNGLDFKFLSICRNFMHTPHSIESIPIVFERRSTHNKTYRTKVVCTLLHCSMIRKTPHILVITLRKMLHCNLQVKRFEMCVVGGYWTVRRSQLVLGQRYGTRGREKRECRLRPWRQCVWT